MSSIDDSVINRHQQYLSPIEDSRPLVSALILSPAVLFVFVFSPLNVPWIVMRVFLSLVMCGMAVFVLSRGHRVLRAVQTGRAASPETLFVPLRAIVIDPRAHGGTYREDAFLQILPDGTLVWRLIDADDEHVIPADQITEIRVEQSVSRVTYPHIVVAQGDGRELQLHLMKPRRPMWRVGATRAETDVVADTLRKRIAGTGEPAE